MNNREVSGGDSLKRLAEASGKRPQKKAPQKE